MVYNPFLRRPLLVFPAFLGGYCAKARVPGETEMVGEAQGFGLAEVEHLARRAGRVSCPSSFSLIPALPSCASRSV